VSQSTERDHSGVIHWAFGGMQNRDAPGEEGRFEQFRKQHKHPMPDNHSLHIHNVLPTQKLKIRGTQRWVTVAENGRLAALDHPEVRALAASYGDPDDVLREIWRPDIPGLTAPGDYHKDYAQDPWPYQLKMWTAIGNGTYPYFEKRGIGPPAKGAR
jgi:hypothetical protein